MQFYRRLFFGPSIKGRKKEVLWKIRHGKPMHNIFLITLPSNPSNLLDIVPMNLLLQPYYKKQNLFIIGVGKGREETLELLRAFVERIFKDTGSVDLKEYFKQEGISV